MEGHVFFLGDDGHIEEGPFASLDEVLAFPNLFGSVPFRRDLHSTVLPLERLLQIGRHLLQSEGDEIDINEKRFVLSGGELVEKRTRKRD